MLVTHNLQRATRWQGENRCFAIRNRTTNLVEEGFMFAIRLALANHIPTYSIKPIGQAGWEVRLEEDQQLRRLDRYQDWHRVERTLALFEREVSALLDQGWQTAELG